MDSQNFPILKNNPHKHIPVLRVDTSIFDLRFGPGCSMTGCNSTCCRGGVWADIGEREAILNNIPIVHKYMDPEQEHDPAKWFETEIIDDQDFPAGKAIGTQVVGKGCVFLDHKGLCVLQKAEMNEGDPKLKLKPFYCTAFPITIVDSVIVYDDYMGANQPQCCSVAQPDGPLTIFDVCAWELEHTVGKAAFEELKAMAGVK